MQMSPLECWDLVQRLSCPPFRDTSTESKCLAILDVRTPQEYSSSHLNGSINLDFKSPSFRDQIIRLDRDKAYLIYCRTGVRSARVLLLMRSLGFRELYNLTNGIEQWQKEGYEVV
jgi:rhodanese-related sulfurtransferase